jgi:hypothetical protein
MIASYRANTIVPGCPHYPNCSYCTVTCNHTVITSQHMSSSNTGSNTTIAENIISYKPKGKEKRYWKSEVVRRFDKR